MADKLTKEERSELMSHIRSKDTKPEVALRHALWRRGFRYRVNVKVLPGTPDIVLPKHRTVVFVHGCFWHGHKGCKISHIPQTNSEFWQAKISRNQERDQEVWRQLEAKGWAVIVVWECELSKSQFDGTIEKVCSDILSNGDSYKAMKAEIKSLRDRWRTDNKLRKERILHLKEEIDKLYHVK